MNKQKNLSIILACIAIVLLISIIVILIIKDDKITKSEAEIIAYEYANVNEKDITNLKIKQEIFDEEYEIEFTDVEYKYEFKIDSRTGRIINFEKDLITKQSPSKDDKVSNSIEMDKDEAKEIALNYLELKEKDVTFTKSKIDRENGKTIYELEFFDEEYEYEINVDIKTKEIAKYSKEPIKSNTSNSNNYISKDKAKKLVLEHSKLSEENIIWHKVELDIDYNIKTYEIEFFSNNLEYEYEVDAINGNILKYEVDFQSFILFLNIYYLFYLYLLISLFQINLESCIY